MGNGSPSMPHMVMLTVYQLANEKMSIKEPAHRCYIICEELEPSSLPFNVLAARQRVMLHKTTIILVFSPHQSGLLQSNAVLDVLISEIRLPHKGSLDLKSGGNLSTTVGPDALLCVIKVGIWPWMSL